MSNAMASHIGNNPHEQSSTNEKGKDTMIEDMEAASHLQDLANCEQLRILSGKLENVKKKSSEACIFKVHGRLGKTKREAYTPLTISIGPYHHGKPELSKMERLKELYTKSFLERKAGRGVEEFWKKLKELEGRAERYYGDDIDKKVSGDKFVEILLLDGCFIVEFVIRSFLRVHGKGQQDEYDRIYMSSGMVSNILRDMLLLENQLPFFVLQALYDMTEVIIVSDEEPEFSKMVKIAFMEMLPKINIFSLLDTEVNPPEIKHLLHVVHILCRPQQEGAYSSDHFFWDQLQTIWEYKLQSIWEYFLTTPAGGGIYDDCIIPTASELQEAGVDFKKVTTSSSLFGIKFNHGVLEIPSFTLFDLTETFFRNLIAFEQHSCDVRPMYFTDYAVFMDDLINTEKDVNLLRLKNIFLNGLGDDKEVTLLFNNLSQGVRNSSNIHFYYKDVYKKLNGHYKRWWNKAMAKLRRNYFHSPWAVISTIAAILLLSLAIIQTFVAVFDLYK